MPLSDELRSLLDLLLEGASQKIIKWESTPSEDIIRAELPDGAAVRITREEYLTEEDERGIRYILSLLRPDGRLLEEWTSDDLGQDAGKLYELFRDARRSALNLDSELKRILGNLQKAVEG